MSNLKNWSTTPASNNSASPNGAPEGMAPSAVNDIIRQQMADHRTQWQDAEWFDWGHVPTRTGNAVFTVPTDLTAVYTANRRLKCSDASTIYASILSSSYTAVTTITVVTDSGNLSASLTAVAVGIFTNGNSFTASDAYPIVAGSADASKKVRLEADGLTTATTRVVTIADRDIAIGKFPTKQIFLSGSGTYTTATGAIRIAIRMIGGGGGGAGSGSAPGPGGNGGDTTFSTLTAAKGTGATATAGGAGGAGTNGDINITGGSGQTSSGSANQPGGTGGTTVFGGAGGGGGGLTNTTGQAAITNTGAGGGGGGCSATTAPGGGGGAGAYVEKTITTPSATYSYAVGAAGTAGTAGSVAAGGAGGSGIIIVEEFYA